MVRGWVDTAGREERPFPATQRKKDDTEMPRYDRHRVALSDVGTSHAHDPRVLRLLPCAKEIVKWKETPPVFAQFREFECLRG